MLGVFVMVVCLTLCVSCMCLLSYSLARIRMLEEINAILTKRLDKEPVVVMAYMMEEDDEATDENTQYVTVN